MTTFFFKWTKTIDTDNVVSVVYFNSPEMDGVERILNDLNVIIYGIEDKSSSSNLFVYKIHNASCHLISLRVCFLYMENGMMMLSTSGVRWQSHKAIYR